MACALRPPDGRRTHHEAAPLEAAEAVPYSAPMGVAGDGEWTLRCDGGARGNPGPGALAYVLLDPGGSEKEVHGEYLGVVTNNIAEYRALIARLDAALRQKVRWLRVCMDSELVVRQMKGEYRVKHEGLKPLHAAAAGAASAIPRVRYQAVRREDNVRADQLVNETLDKILGSESPR